MGWIRNRDTITDWGKILEGANLPRGIQPSDIDGILEVSGHFLVLEKKNPNEATSEGQRIMLDAFSRITHFTVIEVVHGKDGVEEVYDYKTRLRRDTNPAKFIEAVEKWAWKRDKSNDGW